MGWGWWRNQEEEEEEQQQNVSLSDRLRDEPRQGFIRQNQSNIENARRIMREANERDNNVSLSDRLRTINQPEEEEEPLGFIRRYGTQQTGTGLRYNEPERRSRWERPDIQGPSLRLERPSFQQEEEPTYSPLGGWQRSQRDEDDDEPSRTTSRPQYNVLSGAWTGIEQRQPTYNILTNAWTGQDDTEREDYWLRRFSDDPQSTSRQYNVTDAWTGVEAPEPQYNPAARWRASQRTGIGAGTDRSYWQPSNWARPQAGALGRSDVTSGQYYDPNRPMVPTEPRPFGASQQPGMFQREFNELMEIPGEVVQGGNAIRDWYNETYLPGAEQFHEDYVNSPEYRYAQAKSARRRATDPTLMDAISLGMNMGASAGASGAVGGATIGTILGLLNETPWGRELIIRGQDAMDFIFEVPNMRIANAPIPGVGASISEFATPSIESIGSFVKEPPDLVKTNQSVLGWVAEYVSNQVQQSQQLRSTIEKEAQKNPDLWLSLRNLPSGLAAVQQTANLFRTKEQQAADLQAQAVAILETDPLGAGQLFAEAERLQRMMPADIVEEFMNPIAELGYGLVLDPLNLAGPVVAALGLTPEALAATRASRLTDVTQAGAISRLSKAQADAQRLTRALGMSPADAQRIYREITQPYKGLGEKLTDVPVVGQLFQRTADSRANLNVDILWQGMTTIFNGISNSTDAKAILNALATDPTQLIRGLQLSPEAANVLAQADGLVHWNPAVAHKDFVRRVPILGTIANELANMRSLANAEKFNPYEFFAELNGFLVDASKRVEGARLPKSLPFGASDVRLERLGPDSGMVAYVDKQGKIIQRGIEMSLSEAQRMVDGIKGAMTAGKGIGQIALDAAKLPMEVTRRIMSDVWLGMRPANWIGNATGATTMLFANNAYTLLPMQQIQDYLSLKTGGVVSSRNMADTFGIGGMTRSPNAEVPSGAIDWLAGKIAGPDNAISRTMKAIYSVPYGNTEFNFGGLAIPFGEGALRSRAFYMPFMRTFNQETISEVASSFLPALRDMGLDPQMAKQVSNWMTTLVQNGSKSSVVEGMLKLVGKPEIKMTLKDLGVVPELLLPDSVARIERLLSDADLSQAADVLNEIKGILNEERNLAASALHIGGVQPGYTNWTEADMLKEAGWLAETWMQDAARAGVGIDEARRVATETAQAFIKEQNDALNGVLQDLASVPNRPDTWSVTMDFWEDFLNAKRQAREVVNEIGQRAKTLNTPDAWSEKWRVTQETYTGLRGTLSQMAEQARVSLQNVLNGSTYTPRHDWWQTIENYIQWDEQAFLQSRTIDLGRAVDETDARFRQVMDANRSLMDNATYDMVGAFQKFASIENFDIVRQTIQRVEGMGAEVAWKLAEMRKGLPTGALKPEAYAKARNEMWNAYFDHVAALQQTMAKVIVRNGILEQVGATLKWTEPNGAEWQLRGPSETAGKWRAANTTTGEVQEFTVGEPSEANPFTIPKEVADDFRRLTGSEEALDAATTRVMEEIDASAPRPQEVDDITPLSPQISPQRGDGQIDEVVDQPTSVWREPDLEPQVPGYGDVEGVRREPQFSETRPITPSLPSTGRVPSNNEIREMAAVSGISTADKTGRPTDHHLIAALNKNLGTSIKRLDDLTPSQRRAAVDVLAERGAENVPSMRFVEGEERPTVSPTTGGRYTTVSEQTARGSGRSYTQEPTPPAPRDYTTEPAPVTPSGRYSVEPAVNPALTKQQLIAQYADGLRAQGLTDKQIGRMSKSELVRRIENPPKMKDYEFATPAISHVLGMEDSGDIFKVWANAINRSKKIGNDMAPQVGEIAQQKILSINELERQFEQNIEDILRGVPNTLSGAQRVQIMDLVRNWLPNYDKILTQAGTVGERMANWIMLNYNDKRHFDTILNILTPYHYFWSRMPARVAMAALSKPGLVNFFYETNKAIDLENEQANVPDRLRGTVPIPGTNARVNVKTLLNTYAMNGAMNYLTPNPYAEDDVSDNGAERWAKMYERFGPGLGITIELALDIADGKLDKDYSSALNQMLPIPLFGIPVSTLYQMVSGKMPATEGRGIMGKLGFGPDEYDPYRARRALSFIGEEEGLTQAEVDAAQQVILNQANGVDPGTEILPEELDAALALAERAVRRASSDRAAGRMSSYMTTASVQPYTEAEQAMRAAQAGYNASGYDPIYNRAGSKALRTAQIEQDPMLEYSWSRYDEKPGESGRRGQMYDALDGVYAQRQKEIDAAITKNPDMSEADMYAIYEKYNPEIDAIKKKYNVSDLTGGPSTKGMNPQERTQARIESILKYKLPGEPVRPAEGATPEEMRAYYTAKAEYNEKLLKWQDLQLRIATGEEQPYSDTHTLATGMLAGQYASDLARRFSKRFVSDIEYDWVERMALAKEVEDALWAERTETVRVLLGEEGVAAFEKYNGTPKEERAALKATDPIYEEANMAAYNPDEYRRGAELFGPDWYKVYAGRPERGDNLSKAELQAYYNELDAYRAKNPDYSAISLWLNGRSVSDEVGQALKEELGYYPRNFGKDYNEAITLFGPDILGLADARSAAYDKGEETGDAFYRNLSDADIARLKQYDAWRKELQDLTVEEARELGYFDVENTDVEVPNWRTYSGPRPYGSDMQPVASGDQLDVPPDWARGPLLENQTENAGSVADILRPIYGESGPMPATGREEPRMGAIGRAAANAQAKRGENPLSVADILRPTYEDGVPTDVDDKWKKNWKEYESLDDDGKRKYMRKYRGFSNYYRSYNRRRYSRGRSSYAMSRGRGRGYSSYRPSSRRYYGGGGGWGGGGGGGGPLILPAPIGAEQMEGSLWNLQGAQERWEPPFVGPNPTWLMAGRDLAPSTPRKWEPPNWRI